MWQVYMYILYMDKPQVPVAFTTGSYHSFCLVTWSSILTLGWCISPVSRYLQYFSALKAGLLNLEFTLLVIQSPCLLFYKLNLTVLLYPSDCSSVDI